MQKTFVIADMHFDHANIIGYEHRPFRDVEHMNRELIQRWNNTVSKTDRIFVLGDVGFGNMARMQELVTQLQGYKILIMGNHDRGRKPRRWMEAGFDEVSRYPVILDEYIVLSHEPPSYFSEATPYFYIYGHVHGTDMYQTLTKNTACVSVKRWEYQPVELQHLLDLAKLK